MYIYMILIIVQTVLMFSRTLRRRGIYFFVFGFAVKINVGKGRGTPRRISTLEKMIIANVMFISATATLFLILFIEDIILFRQALFFDIIMPKFKKFIESIDIFKLYLFAWMMALIIGLPHEFLHVFFGRRVGMEMRSLYIVTLMGFPLLFLTEANEEGATNMQRAFMISGGILMDSIVLLASAILYLLYPENIWMTAIFYVVLAYILINGSMINIIKADGVQLFFEVAKEYGDRGIAILLCVWFITIFLFILRPLII